MSQKKQKSLYLIYFSIRYRNNNNKFVYKDEISLIKVKLDV